ncbi:MAG: SIS domain-containing protein [Candidatus Omnitrophota bacterium]
MNNSIEGLIASSDDIEDFAKGYFDYVSGLLRNMDTAMIKEFVEEFEYSRKDQSTMFFAGNGGSAATASHMVNDLGFGTRVHVDPPIRVLSLSDNLSAITAVANDTGYDNVFIRQLQVYYRPGDKLVVISASGNSPNLVRAAEWVKEKGGKVLGFLGFDGGKLIDICDVAVSVKTPHGEYGPVEDVHMILDHLIYTWIWHAKRKG